jgi:hypothetical protein
MSESADLLEEAAFKISHGGQILRLASLQSKDEALARELWRLSAAAEAMAEELKTLFASITQPSAAGGSASASRPETSAADTG